MKEVGGLYRRLGFQTFPRSAYIAGPMSRIERFNFPAFDAAAARLRDDGWFIINPAEMDREDGFDETNCTGYELLTDEQRHQFARNDIDALLSVEAIILLPGWERSVGATNEAQIAGWLGLKGYELINGVLEPIDLAHHKWSAAYEAPK